MESLYSYPKPESAWIESEKISGTRRINICYNTVRSKLYTFNRIRYKIFCNRIKLLDISISTDQNLFQSICDRNSICNFIFNTFAVG